MYRLFGKPMKITKTSNGWGEKQRDDWPFPHFQWIGLRENLQETIDFPTKYGAFL